MLPAATKGCQATGCPWRRQRQQRRGGSAGRPLAQAASCALACATAAPDHLCRAKDVEAPQEHSGRDTQSSKLRARTFLPWEGSGPKAGWESARWKTQRPLCRGIMTCPCRLPPAALAHLLPLPPHLLLPPLCVRSCTQHSKQDTGMPTSTPAVGDEHVAVCVASTCRPKGATACH